ncbi:MULTISPECIES: 50S ribosomal protein L11 methyltransferase [Rhodanobacter]|uniref:50S ribosomal protein L11 methyltransferase n=1 Tax=Rhodanobacter TaxID=75309 RepID=UPI00040576B0|nr:MULTISPECIES: 50S ribosomal protein L11 methyltransferase [Rhodanobacter]KZC19157.1 ribosomal protein L11 methyltransferase [Rhodanobacter denitrificans]UJJ51432.1 50S ribosomal protein L11 methyltransferase [Rhodanobacter denitrificans]UJJ59786.1 50S ribosomal protein L11 methyltransferase [Rhodanobacter denitrificans]UJM94178.1 50S ribosomal protein L11 methyltransferase [Rhodanobacter denitrificans]UJM97707.1 50S ribosomal protein L11 methyltransferase [Rhodanobacter denitrificans]
MPFLELSLVVRTEQQPRAEEALDDLGALSITLRDADAETPDEQAIFEPGVGELPLWPTITLNALFDEHVDRRGLAAALGELLPWLEPDQLNFAEVADQDWERAWMDQFKPMPFGRRLWIYPWNIEPPIDDERVVVRLDPGLAFGSGTHPTTALCLEWLDGLDLAGKTLTDYGCGSGILAIAALKLGAASAVGVDNDPQALIASRDNAERNGVAERLALFLPEDHVVEAADVFIANILAGPLGTLAPRFAAAAKPGAPFAISGILAGQQDELLARYAEWFDELHVDTRGDWVRISGRRRG